MLHDPIVPRRRGKQKPSQRFIAPLLPTLVTEPPEGDDWSHEIKYDGYRTQIHVSDGTARAFTRNGHDWTDRYTPLINAAVRFPCEGAIIDGEVIVQGEGGRCDFGALREAIRREPHRLVFMAFDLLELDGQDLRSRPLERRRELLNKLVGRNDPANPIQYSAEVVGHGRAFSMVVAGMGSEGIVSKKLGSRYVSGRSKNWLKIKSYTEGEFVVIGAEHEPGKPAFALLARETDDGLEYAGSAFVTLGGDERDRFWTSIEQHGRDQPPLPMQKRKSARWTEPVMRVHVQYLKGEGKLRHATIREVLP